MIVRGPAVTQWVGEQLGIDDFGPCESMGFIVDSEPVGGVVFNNYRGHCIEVSVASTHPKWCTRGHLREIFRYPFQQLGVIRLQAHTRKSNKHARRFMERLGFQFEGKTRRGFGDEDGCLYSMLPHEVKYG